VEALGPESDGVEHPGYDGHDCDIRDEDKNLHARQIRPSLPSMQSSKALRTVVPIGLGGGS